MDPRIRIHTKISWIRNIEEELLNCRESLPAKQGAPGGAVHVPFSWSSGQWPKQKQVIPVTASSLHPRVTANTQSLMADPL